MSSARLRKAFRYPSEEDISSDEVPGELDEEVPNGKPANVRMNSATFDGQRPIRRYLTYLNGGLSILVGLNAFRFRSKEGVHDGFWLFFVLPSAMFFIVVLAKRTMFSVDIEGLEKLKYPYKGA
ncbi:MAG: hypothetical protein LQ341_004909 [Variospora aurantia]|nr:MAG: hypothetical protein LQ341_004909 [Variospora aurantia]